jgi:hypothetical protein
LHGIGSPKFSQKDRNRHRVEQWAKINHVRRRQPGEFRSADVQPATIQWELKIYDGVMRFMFPEALCKDMFQAGFVPEFHSITLDCNWSMISALLWRFIRDHTLEARLSMITNDSITTRIMEDFLALCHRSIQQDWRILHVRWL